MRVDSAPRAFVATQGAVEPPPPARVRVAIPGVWRKLLSAVVVNGDLDDYMNYYKERYRSEHHLSRYDDDTIERLNLAHDRNDQELGTF